MRWRVREHLRDKIWIIPTLFAVVAIAAGIVLPLVDGSTGTTIGITFDPEAARSVLGSLAGGMITFTGFVFSTLLVAVQFGSSQFSPRMLLFFLRDLITQVALGTFIATFLYSLLVLSSVGRPENPEFVPDDSISIALFMLLASMFMFLRLITNTASGLRVASVLGELAREARRVIDQVHPEPAVDDEGGEDGLAPLPEDCRVVVYRGEPGVLQGLDRKDLLRLTAGTGAVIELVPAIGDLVAPGDPLFRVRAGSGPLDEGDLRSSIAVGDERSMEQDPAFAFRLLADISTKALSPGVNDPSTATQALNQIETLLRVIAHRRLTPGATYDHAGVARLRWRAPSWEDYLSLALDETRQFGEGSVQVVRRLWALLQHLRETVPSYRRPAVEAQLELVRSGARRAFGDERDRNAATTADPQGLGSSRGLG
ncbi:putative membrane protein [Actinopolyspora biskrensis]|uniref:Putative membrane protein n=1 Tax=Actinopolyspora biskrensis TaxID=1470178 RepID=A0A852YU98_9ACTN|nr:putative membrane protein [Actinopolyspora biskrensis]